MRKPGNKYDDALQDYAQKWLKSLERPRYSTSISNFFIAIFVFMWASTLTDQLGYTPYKGYGIVFVLIIAVALILALIFTNSILLRIGFSKPTRSAIWFSALMGPYISIITLNNWNNPALSHIAGIFSGLIAFVLSYGIDKTLNRKSETTGNK